MSSTTAPATEARWHSTRVRLLAGDITQVSVAAIVNAANSALARGRGVDGAIHAAADVAISAVRAWPGAHPDGSVEDVIRVLRGAQATAALRGAMTRQPSA